LLWKASNIRSLLNLDFSLRPRTQVAIKLRRDWLAIVCPMEQEGETPNPGCDWLEAILE
jgi:hypothetical protein